ncbi:Uncharacterised protein [Vibrio cholerae]|nr:Uncharacterised protein [Vibrio cholerae]CSB36512.1 Uncharacterised protein [Vibrio cholerae]
MILLTKQTFLLLMLQLRLHELGKMDEVLLWLLMRYAA